MAVILKPLYEWIVDQYQLFENPLYNWLFVSLIGAIGFVIAWLFVGRLYREQDISGGCIGSLIHWTIRIVSALIMIALVSLIISFVKFILTMPWWGWVIWFAAAALLVIFLILLRNHNSNEGAK